MSKIICMVRSNHRLVQSIQHFNKHSNRVTIISYEGSDKSPPMLPPKVPQYGKLPDSSFCNNSDECGEYCCAIFITNKMPMSNSIGYCCPSFEKALENWQETC